MGPPTPHESAAQAAFHYCKSIAEENKQLGFLSRRKCGKIDDVLTAFDSSQRNDYSRGWNNGNFYGNDCRDAFRARSPAAESKALE